MDVRTGHLPSPVTRFVGRGDDVRALVELVTRHRLVTLTGLGGCGKTRLAVEVASHQTEAFEDGVWFVDLAPVSDPSEVDRAVARALEVRTSGSDRTDRQSIIDQFRGHHALIVLDNCEHVLARSGELAADITSNCGAVHVLATSREVLELHGEASWPVPPLSLPGGTAVADVLASESGTLFIDRARLAQPRFTLTEHNAVEIAGVCERLEGIPLAIELAAARLRSLPLERIAVELDERFSLLTSGGRDVAQRQQSLQASIEWSHELLGPLEAATFRQLSVFLGGFSLEAAEAVVALPEDGDRTVADVVGRLVDRSLVVLSVDGMATDRYQLLETVRAFGADRLTESGGRDEACDRHRRWFTAWCVDIGRELEGPNVSHCLHRVPIELPNIRAALRWAELDGDGASMAAILGALSWFWIWEGYQRECAEWLDRVEPLLDALPPQERLPARWCGVQLSTGYFDYFHRRADLLACLVTTAVEAGDERMLARANGILALGASYDGPEASRAQLEVAARRCDAADDVYWMARLEAGLGYSYQLIARNDLSVGHIDRMGRLARLTGNPILMVQHLSHRAWNQFEFGDFDAVRADLAEMHRLYEPLEDCNVAVDTGTTIQAMLDIACGELAPARLGLETLLDQLVRDGDAFATPGPACMLSGVYAAQGEPEEALGLLELVAGGVPDDSIFQIALGFSRANALLALGDVMAATTAYGETIKRTEARGNLKMTGHCQLCMAAIERSADEHRSAAQRMRSALAGFVLLGYPMSIATAYEELAGLEGDRGLPEIAARLFGAASAIREPRGAYGRAIRQATYDADLKATRSALGAARFDENWNIGLALSVDEVVQLLEPPNESRSRPSFGWDSLTPTELRVAELVAEGLANPAIAERLVIGRETVKTHVSHIYTKLGISTRAELAVEVTKRA